MVAFLGHVNLACVRNIDGIPIAAVDELARSIDRELDHLGVVPPYRSISAKLRARTFSVSNTHFLQSAGNYQQLTLDALLAWCSALPFVPETLVLDRFESDLAACWRWFVASRVPALVLRPLFVPGEPMAWELALNRDGALVATWHGRLYGEREPEGLGAALAALPPDALSSIVVRAGVKLEAKLKQRFLAELGPAIDRQRRVAKRSLFE
jgi:hypothetical protein